MSENCKSLVLQDKCNIEIFLSLEPFVSLYIFVTGDLVLVMLPGHFVHLLNVGIEFEPCHHILLHSKSKFS